MINHERNSSKSFQWYFTDEKMTKNNIKIVTVNCNIMLQARRTESSIQKFRQKAQKRTGAASGASDQNVSETDKMCMQLFLDTQVSSCFILSNKIYIYIYVEKEV